MITLLTIFLLNQVPWEKETVQGVGIDKGKIDYTEGIAAYFDLPLKPNTKNFDNGGGSHDYNSLFLLDQYGVTNRVYDPFQRSPEHNNTILQEVLSHNFDTATSNSVLNVINTPENRLHHIWLSCESLKNMASPISASGQAITQAKKNTSPTDTNPISPPPPTSKK